MSVYVCMCMYVYVCMHMYVCVYVCICMYVCILFCIQLDYNLVNKLKKPIADQSFPQLSLAQLAWNAHIIKLYLF